MRNVLSGTKKVSLLASVCFVSLLGVSAANATELYYSYTDSATLQPGYTGDNDPTLSNGGSTGSSSSPVSVNAPASPNFTSPSILFSVDPNNCLSGSGRYCPTNGTLDASVSVTFHFYSGVNGSLLGTLTDTADADFDYSTSTDNLCWTNSPSVGGNATLLTTTQSGGCSLTKSQNSGTGDEQIKIQLGTEDYIVQLNDWTDWDEMPTVQFQDGGPATTTGVPEPFTLSLFGAGLAGAGAMRRRRKAR